LYSAEFVAIVHFGFSIQFPKDTLTRSSNIAGRILAHAPNISNTLITRDANSTLFSFSLSFFFSAHGFRYSSYYRFVAI